MRPGPVGDIEQYRVKKNVPCPICKKIDWCLSDGETWAVCQRTESEERWQDAGWYHNLNGNHDNAKPQRRTNRGNVAPAKQTAKRATMKKRLWPNEATAQAALEKLPRAKDVDSVAKFLLADYGLTGEHIPINWRVFNHPRLGEGIVYPGRDYVGGLTVKFKPIKRNAAGKRQPCDFLCGNANAALVFKGQPDADMVIVAGEEKAAAAATTGRHVVCPLTGEKKLSDEWVRLILDTNPPHVIHANDADESGQQANEKSASALDGAGYPYEHIGIAPIDSGDLNDVLKQGGVEALENVLKWDTCVLFEPAIKPLDVWDIERLFAYEPPENECILGDNLIVAGELALFVGPPEIGKSRLALQLIVDMLLGQSLWVESIPICRHDIKVLLLQTENSHRRMKKDLGAQLRGCTPEQRDYVRQMFKFHVPERPEDRDLGLDDPVNVERLKKTVRRHKPDLIVADPYGDFFAGSNENDAVETRRTVKALMNIVQAYNTKTSCLLIHHARSGKAAAGGAEGWECGAFARGSKALTSIARSQINVAPGDSEGESLVIGCGKNNDGRRFGTFAVRLDEETHKYCLDYDFDLDEWRIETGNRKGGAKKKVNFAMIRAAIGTQTMRYGDLVKALKEIADCGERTVKRAISEAVEAGKVEKTDRGYRLNGQFSATVPIGAK